MALLVQFENYLELNRCNFRSTHTYKRLAMIILTEIAIDTSDFLI